MNFLARHPRDLSREFRSVEIEITGNIIAASMVAVSAMSAESLK